MTQTMQDKATAEFEREVKLHINQMLFDKGYISEQMFQAAKRKLLER